MSKKKGAKGRSKAGLDDEKDQSLAYKVLSSVQTQQLMELDVDQLQSKMVEVMQLPNHTADLKEAAILDYYVAGFWWGKERGFTVQQLSGFFTALHRILENVKDKHLSMVDNLKEFKKMLVGVGQENPESPGGLEFFDLNQAKMVADYLHTSIFQHYKLYEFIFSHTQAEEIIGADLDVNVAKPADMPWPPPLEEGVPEDIFNEHIRTPPPTPPPEPEAEDGNETPDDTRSKEEIAAQKEREAFLMAELGSDQVKAILSSVAKEMIGGLSTEMASKLRERENSIINRINKIHKVADS
ncbi:ciliary-associated calcium-binding coiled-coil protein 1 isoform X2 [Lingula anatina]|uniref:Ciliary-associated calcium-binding coiled-coil protein 1 isoform X2 n=1 Tax=Lingula anatina TaxID=7574 RepID=A0A1S3H837_LINAN|nr:ciliary-associated calcium-binding coiled-coil protein 1 isoform X2 [Lingula anatina]|eukprot:XP_013381651.1 ciliary-associated calcium-binding coiled-coil protein 1 isoform X2 [Lingula anatina]